MHKLTTCIGVLVCAFILSALPAHADPSSSITPELNNALALALATQRDAVTRWNEAVWWNAVAQWVNAITALKPQAPAPAPALSAPRAGACGGWAAEVQAHFKDPARACRVLMCESGGNPNARNRSGASGLMQIMMPMHAHLFAAHGWSSADVFDGEKNLIIASEMANGGGWGGWVCG